MKDKKFDDESLLQLGKMNVELMHEIKNLLAISHGAWDMIEGLRLDEVLSFEPEAKEAFRKNMCRAMRSQERMFSLVYDVIQLGRIQKSLFRRTSLMKVIASALEGHAGELKREQIMIVLPHPTEDLEVLVNGPVLEQALMKLFQYASDSYGGIEKIQDKKIEIGFGKSSEKTACLVLTSYGQEIAPEDLSRIFDPFFQPLPHIHRPGLGLSYTEKVVAIHGGTIAVESGPTCGTRFTLLLPQMQREHE